ncbi:MAG: protein-L-isoaspartate(D-aspartate) O-methyltransferase [Alphaproteobacteria bacterium]|nr:protein-L-isoaspartate(D-aspartate) O-methyltransferase [Alphaproteobacteria bacterium]
MSERDDQLALLSEIDAELRLTADQTGRDRLSPRVRTVFQRVPRREFVPEPSSPFAYDNRPLPIGAGQTISQPFIVALMTELLDLTPESHVLEIGTGSGYQTALLAELAADVFTVERITQLSEQAQETLASLGYRNIHFRIGDGHAGWAEHAPYDAIIVTATAQRVPYALLAQLAVGGRLLLPLGQTPFRSRLLGQGFKSELVVPDGQPARNFGQELTLVRRLSAKRFEETPLLEVAFVPLIEDAKRESD